MRLSSKQIEKLFRLAIEQMPVANARVIAAIYDGKELISVGRNQQKTHTFQQKFKKNNMANWIHAEVNAIYKAIQKIGIKRLEHCTMYIVRAKKDMKTKEWVYGLAAPCCGCQSAIEAFKIKEVYYSTDEGDMKSIW